MRSPHRVFPLLAALFVVTAACGSNLSEEEILAKSGVQKGGAPAAVASPGASGGGTATGSTPGATGAATPGGAATGTPGAGGGAAAPASDVAAGGGSSGSGGVAAAGATGCTTNETGPILVGSVGNYSGAGGASQANFPRAVQVWANMINSQGGLCGREVQVIVQDDGGDPARYGALIRDMVENRKIVAFVGNGAVLSYQGGLAYHNQSGVPVFGNDCAQGPYFTSPVIAPTCPAFPDMVEFTMRAGVEVSGKTKMGFVYCREAQACQEGAGFVRERAAAAGATIVYDKEVSLAQIDFTAECQEARNRGAELFTVGADAATGARFAKSCAGQNWFPQYLGINLTYGPETLSQRGFENVIVGLATFPFAGASGGAIDEFNQAIGAFAPGIGRDPALSISWTGAKLFELVATKAAQASGSITPQTLVAALHTVQNETLGGLTVPLSYGPNGTTAARCYFVIQGDGTGQGYTLPYGSQARCP